ncbi:MAG: hypothetical protein IJS60_05045 [Abditibacteriota bacterium]|nr:hypothetical protein [Abditibacteriota bacterium]
MDNKLIRFRCYDEKEIKSKEIYEHLFDKNKNVQERYLESSIQKFISLNESICDFLGINIKINNSGNNLSIKFISNNYIGAIPIKMPYDGIAHKDIQVIPRFGEIENSDTAISNLTQLISKLEYSISPEYLEGVKLVLPLQLRPPMYYEAVKYIDLFEKAQKNHWVKFEVVKGNHNYPKSSTNWAKYGQTVSDPRKALIFPSSDSILSLNHSEWRNLIYVFEIAKSYILQQNIPGSIRYNYQNKISILQNKIYPLKALSTDSMSIHAIDPQVIKEAKYQANFLLQKSSNSCMAWRIDMAELFERYIQHIIAKSLQGINGLMKPNEKIQGSKCPSWGLRYLEPDIIINLNSNIYMADVKYKSHFLNLGDNSEKLKEEHRADLHQLLAYCSFTPNTDKTGFIFYPSSQKVGCKKVSYQINGIKNTVYLFGIPFGIDKINESIDKLKLFFIGLLNNNLNEFFEEIKKS